MILLFDVPTDKNKSFFTMSDEFLDLVDTLHKSVCGSAPVSLCGFVGVHLLRVRGQITDYHFLICVLYVLL